MIHQFKLNGYNIVLDVFSGSVHVVDDVAYDLIAMYKNQSSEDIYKSIKTKYPKLSDTDRDECLSDIKELEKS